jgi:uncharacterized protein
MSHWGKLAAKVLSLPLLGLVYFYRYALSPLKPASCRHVPTCSEYMIQSLKIHGPAKGLWFGLERIFRCHPWGTHGFDPVPPKGTRFYWKKKRD